MNSRNSFILMLIFAVLAVMAVANFSHALSIGTPIAVKRFVPWQSFDAQSCTSQVQGALKLHAMHATNMAAARAYQVQELNEMRQTAWKLASIATYLFAICLALLWTLIFWKYVLLPRFSRTTAIALSLALIVTNFLAAFLWVKEAALSQQDFVKQFKKNIDEVNVEVLHVKGNLPRSEVGRFLVKVHSSYIEIPKIYYEANKRLPTKKSRWWTLGWDHVSFIDFELAAAQALQLRFELEAAGMKNALPLIKELCSQG